MPGRIFWQVGWNGIQIKNIIPHFVSPIFSNQSNTLTDHPHSFFTECCFFYMMPMMYFWTQCFIVLLDNVSFDQRKQTEDSGVHCRQQDIISLSCHPAGQCRTHPNWVYDLKLAHCLSGSLSDAPQVTVKQKSRVKDINEEVRVGKLFMVDLAGTERASQVCCVFCLCQWKSSNYLEMAHFIIEHFSSTFS